MYTLESLQASCRKGRPPRFVFFWKPEPAGCVGPGCFSQWQAAPFELDGQRYVSAEHYMMAEKARLFDDDETRNAILKVGNPQQIKHLGRQVRNFRETVWAEERENIIFRGNMAKFSQNQPLGELLSATGSKILSEASPHDRIWGIGLEASDKRAKNPLLWRGKNLLGFCLMRVRDSLYD